MVDNSDEFKEMFNHLDPDKSAELFITGWNKIIEAVAPLKRIQIKRNNNDIISKEADDIKKAHDTALDDAITNKDSEGFRLAKSLKNKLNKTRGLQLRHCKT